MEYQAIFIIVDRGLGHEVVDVATEAGARGARLLTQGVLEFMKRGVFN